MVRVYISAPGAGKPKKVIRSKRIEAVNELIMALFVSRVVISLPTFSMTPPLKANTPITIDMPPSIRAKGSVVKSRTGAIAFPTLFAPKTKEKKTSDEDQY